MASVWAGVLATSLATPPQTRSLGTRQPWACKARRARPAAQAATSVAAETAPTVAAKTAPRVAGGTAKATPARREAGAAAASTKQELIRQAKARVLDAVAAQFQSWSSNAAVWRECTERAEEQAMATAEGVVEAVGGYSEDMRQQLVQTGACSRADLEVRRRRVTADTQGARFTQPLPAYVQGPPEALLVCFFERGFKNLLLKALQEKGNFWGGADAVPADRCGWARATRLLPQRAVERLMERGLLVLDGALSPAEVRAARDEVRALQSAGRLQPVEFQSPVRNDKIGWIESHGAGAASLPALGVAARLLRALPAEVAKHTGWALAVPQKVRTVPHSALLSSASSHMEATVTPSLSSPCAGDGGGVRWKSRPARLLQTPL